MLVVIQLALAFMPPLGYTSRIQVTIQVDGQYKASVLACKKINQWNMITIKMGKSTFL